MPTIRARARAQLPSVLLTLLSIIQAVALERLWGLTVQREDLFILSWHAGLGWLQIANIFFAIVVIWLVYLGLVMRFRWTPSTGDLTYPLVVGVVELMLIETMGIENLGKWFMVFALVFLLLQWLAHNLYRRAREDPENKQFFEFMARATWQDHIKRTTVSLIAIIFGILLWDSAGKEWLALLGLLMCTAVVLSQIWASHKFWESSMAMNPEVPSVNNVSESETAEDHTD